MMKNKLRYLSALSTRKRKLLNSISFYFSSKDR